ncbi:related to Ribonuclease H [Ustilago trichophora]|uniref:ribonuclease H n=1 Tax=Ustilago trichophora TaxID=86804 RepID=A0A5C3E7E1_9BASI|nr:related to Ribonuclease H [Ustilago trichophora]
MSPGHHRRWRPALFPKIIVYCDGACLHNGRNGASAGWGVYFEDPDLSHLNESCRLSGEIQTNQRAELMAMIRAAELSPRDGRRIIIRTDSMYSINTVTEWLPKWERNGWRNARGQPVSNQDLIKRLDYELYQHTPEPILEYVEAHSGLAGNEEADRLAREGARLTYYGYYS